MTRKNNKTPYITFCRRGNGCSHGAVVNIWYCHVEVLGSNSGQGKIYTKNYVSVVLAAHSAVMSK